jgi:hypothetical protein
VPVAERNGVKALLRSPDIHTDDDRSKEEFGS